MSSNAGRPKKNSALKDFVTAQRERARAYMKQLTPVQAQAVRDTVDDEWSMYSFPIRYDGQSEQLDFDARRRDDGKILIQCIRLNNSTRGME